MSIGAVLPSMQPLSPYEGAVQITQPAWLADIPDERLMTDDARRSFVDELGRAARIQTTYGGWTAAVVNEDSGEIVSAAVGQRLSSRAEPDLFHDPALVALLQAQNRLGTFTLTDRPLVLVTNQPLTRASFGQGNWSGLHRIICAPRYSSGGPHDLQELYPASNWQEVLARGPSRTQIDEAKFAIERHLLIPDADGMDPRVRVGLSFVSDADIASATDPSLGWQRGAIHLTMPAWLQEFAQREQSAKTPQDRLKLAVALSRRNVDAKTGGPFGSALYTPQGDIYAVGVNRVFPQNSSILHGEMMAFIRALTRYHMESAAGNHSAPSLGFGGYTLATNCDTCVGCLMATLDLARFGFISGMDRAGLAQDARDIGFEEGEMPADFEGILRQSGVALSERALQPEARRVILDFAASGETIYNADAARGAEIKP